MKLPVFKAFGATFALVFSNIGEIFRISWLPLLFLAAGSIWFLPQYLTSVAAMISLGEHPDPQQVMAVIGPMGKWIGVFLLLTLIFYPMIHAGLLRFAVRGQRATGFFYFRFGADEIRILLTSILWFLIYMGVVFAATFGIMLLVTAVAAASRGAAGIAGAVAGIAAFVCVFWILLRLSLCIPASIGTEKIGIGPSWSATKGNVWNLLGYFLLWYLFIVIVECIAIAMLMPALAPQLAQVTAAAGDPRATEQAMAGLFEHFAKLMDYRNPMILAGLFIGYLISIVFYALFICSGGVAYRMMTEGGSEE